MIDLHLHTTASDGRLSPDGLIARCAAQGLTTISVTDHDTVAAIGPATRAAGTAGLTVVPGIEITAVADARDVHVLGYFIDRKSDALARFLERQRALRVDRVREIGARLARLGLTVDLDQILGPRVVRPGSSVGRPLIARALVEAGHVADVQEAFDRYLAAGQPAFVPRTGRSPADVVRIIHDAGGVASLAHPGLTRRDDLIEPLAAEGLDALEAYHTDHPPETRERYRQLADRLGLGLTGGTDFHADGERRGPPGTTTLPPEAFDDLARRAARRAAS